MSGKARGEPASADGKPHSTSGSIQGLGYLLTALRRQRLASDKPVLQLATFLRSHDLFLELSVRWLLVSDWLWEMSDVVNLLEAFAADYASDSGKGDRTTLGDW